MRSSALQRRFVLAPLVVLGLLGGVGDLTDDLTAADPDAGPRATVSPTADPQAEIRVALTDALEAQHVFYVDHLLFAAGRGAELEQLRELDPSVGWGSEVVVEVPAEEGAESPILVLRAPLPGGGSLCVAWVTSERDAGLWYARPSGDEPCPPVEAGMPGWSADEMSGWGNAARSRE